MLDRIKKMGIAFASLYSIFTRAREEMVALPVVPVVCRLYHQHQFWQEAQDVKYRPHVIINQ